MGFILATLISLFVINYCLGTQIVFKHYFKNGKLGEYFALNFRYAVVTVGVCIVTVWLCKNIVLEGVVGLGIRCLIGCVVPKYNLFIGILY